MNTVDERKAFAYSLYRRSARMRQTGNVAAADQLRRSARHALDEALAIEQYGQRKPLAPEVTADRNARRRAAWFPGLDKPATSTPVDIPRCFIDEDGLWMKNPRWPGLEEPPELENDDDD
jgi:hypothetical protein